MDDEMELAYVRMLARRTLKDQDFDDLITYIEDHRGNLPANIYANAMALKAFTLLDEVWIDSDMQLNDFGDEQSDAIYVLQVSILGAGTVNSDTSWQVGE